MTKITGYPPDSSPALSDVLPMVKTATDTTVKVTLSDIAALLNSTIVPSGQIAPYAGRSAPIGWLLCDGSAISRTTYSDLFSAIVPSIGNPTITIASPGVLTLAGHGLNTGSQVYLTTGGTLPTGLTANTLYYVIYVDSSTFKLATSRANAYAGTAINTSGSQSGTHTIYACPYGLGDGSSTFNIPDVRGRTLAGADAMGGTAASRLTLSTSQGAYGNLGAVGGEQDHTLLVAELASHSHRQGVDSSYNAGSGGTSSHYAMNNTGASWSASAAPAGGTAGNDNAHNNIQPTLVTNYMIKT